MSELNSVSANFTPLQEELLRLYSLDLEEKDLLQIKELIDKYILENITKREDEAIEKKNISPDDFDRWVKENF